MGEYSMVKDIFLTVSMVHSTHVPASSLNDTDKGKFTKTDAESLQGKLRFSSVVSTEHIRSFLSRANDIFTKALKEPDYTEKKALGDLHDTIHGFAIGIASDNEANEAVLKVSEERQLNVWLNKLLSSLLSKRGFRQLTSFPENRYSVFGSSCPDLVFVKHGRNVVGTMVEVPCSSQSLEQQCEQVGENPLWGTIFELRSIEFYPFVLC